MCLGRMHMHRVAREIRREKNKKIAIRADPRVTDCVTLFLVGVSLNPSHRPACRGLSVMVAQTVRENLEESCPCSDTPVNDIVKFIATFDFIKAGK